MPQIIEQTQTFARIAGRNLADMFGIEPEAVSEVTETPSVVTSKSFIVSIYYTGTVYGEYLLAMDEETAARVIGFEDPICDENRDELRDEICDALCELLNTVVGESIVHLQSSHAKLTVTPPRSFFGALRYPKFRTGRATLETSAGAIECHFCLDLMRLDLATSYAEAMSSLLEVNAKLKEANRHLAEQQAQLVHTEKMASVGILASGVAHEINTPLFFVDANLGSLEDYVQVIESTLRLYERLCESLQGVEGLWTEELRKIQVESEEQDIEFVVEDTKQLLRESQQGIARIKDIVQGLRDFSQIDRSGLADVDLNVLAENAYALLAGELPENCRVEWQLDSRIPRVVCNAAEIGQVVTGVLLNAGQACRHCDAEREFSIAIRTDVSDAAVTVTIEDNGHGIAPENLDRVFEPFFTTRDEGDGAGLGLSIAYGILRRHQGSIGISSRQGSGTRVTIRLPLSLETAAV
ncbi:MAG: chemotaxis protein CheX [Planctomycetales bacterium]|nr:chemotaxis protein CheX [Planctomycetales bacterium]